MTSPRATFAVIHGLGEHSGRYESFASAMAKRQFSTFAVDLRGMGKSEGTRGHVESWSEWVQDAAALVAMIQDHPSAGEVIPVGHSFGGVVLLSAVIREAILVRRFVLSSRSSPDCVLGASGLAVGFISTTTCCSWPVAGMVTVAPP